MYRDIELIEGARKALMARSSFRVRYQIYIAYVLVFFFAAGTAWALIYNIRQIQQRMEFLEFANDVAANIQQARRYEKNFFLYGTNLDDALENIHLARANYVHNAEQFAKILGRQKEQAFLVKIESYESLLDQLKSVQRKTPQQLHDPVFRSQVEQELRQFGKSIIQNAQALISREKTVLKRTLAGSQNLHLFTMMFLLVFLAVHAYLFVHRIYITLRKFSDYAKRIADGDLTPITPRRRFRDEFTELALAINEMIKEMDAREAALIQAHKIRAVGTLTAGVAHELNNPLNNIMLTAHMLMEDFPDLSDEEKLEMLVDITEETGRARDIIANLLDFVRESTSTIEALHLDQLLADTIHLAENQVRFAGISIDLQVTENLPSIHGDSQKLKQVFLNLILNAADASPEGGKVQVMALPAEKPNHVAVKVIDHGGRNPGPHPFLHLRSVLHHQGKGAGNRPGAQRFPGNYRQACRQYSGGKPGPGADLSLPSICLSPPSLGASPATSNRILFPPTLRKSTAASYIQTMMDW